MDERPDQKEYWRREHKTQAAFTRIHSDKPSQPVEDLADFLMLANRGTSDIRIVDAGCGKGRNSAYLAKRGFRVTGVDFISGVIEEARRRHGDLRGITFDTWDISATWPLRTESIDAIIDCNTTISLYAPQRENMIRESYRVLKNRGYYLFYGVGSSPELVEQYPGSEPNSILFPTGRFEKRYSEDELLDAYGKYALIDIESIPGSDRIDGQEIYYNLWVALFQKLS